MLKPSLAWKAFLGFLCLFAVAGGGGAADVARHGKAEQQNVMAAATVPNPEAHFNPKKGLAYGGPRITAKLSALGAACFYNWGNTRPEGVDPKFIYTPMIWSGAVQVLGRLNKIDPQGDSGALLGFNEPDFKDQANMSVEEALDYWPKLETTGRRLGSPAMALNPLRQGSWLQDFLEGTKKRNYRVDFIVLHWYGPPVPLKFLEWVDQVHAAFGKPIWITEFAVADWAVKNNEGFTRYSVTQVEQFMKTVIPGLEKRDFVEHYFWFSTEVDSSVMGTSALFNDDGSLTELGQLYSKF